MSVEKIDVLLFYEVADRELDVACAMKVFAERDFGLKVKIVQQPFGERLTDLTMYQPTIVLLPNVYTSCVYNHTEWPQATYVSLRWEQIFYKGVVHIKPINGPFATQHVIHMSWGDSYNGYLLDKGVPPQNIFTNGQPAYMLYRPPYQRYFTPRAELAARFGLDPNRRWIFFPENYRWVLYTESQIRKKKDPEGTRIMHNFCLQSLDILARWFAAAAEQYPAAELIVRPRPSTPINTFRSLLLNSIPTLPPRFHLIKDLSVREWILASDVTMSSFSTSLIESAVADKPTYMFEPIPTPDNIYMDWHDLMPHVRTEAELGAVCAAPITTRPNALAHWAETNLLSRGDAIYNLAAFLSQLAGGRFPAPPPAPKSALEFVPVPPVPAALLYDYYKFYRRYERLRRKLRPTPVVVPEGYEKDMVYDDEIEKRVERWRTTLTGYRPTVNAQSSIANY